MAIRKSTYSCSQEGTISEIKTNVAMMQQHSDKLDSKLDDVLNALNESNQERKVHSAELHAAYKAVSQMLQDEREAREKQESIQAKISETINSIANRVGSIEFSVSNIKTEVKATKDAFSANSEKFEKRITKLERIEHFLYAIGVVVASIVIILIYADQMVSTLRKQFNGPQPTQRQIVTDKDN